MAIQVEPIVVPGSDGNKYRTMANAVSQFYVTHPDYKHVSIQLLEGDHVHGNVVAFLLYEVN